MDVRDKKAGMTVATIKSYPLPPLFLTEVIEAARKHHTHKHNQECIEDPGYCEWSQRYSCDMEPVIVEISEGYGRHVHDDCKPGNCFADCDDSDWVVELQYHSEGYHAVYGIKRAGDVQDVSLWAD